MAKRRLQNLPVFLGAVGIAAVFLSIAVAYQPSESLPSPSGALAGFRNQSNNTHLACVGQACVPVVGGGPNLCTSNAQCQNQTNQTHLACVLNTCTVVPGPGQNTCLTAGAACNGTNQTNQTPDLTVLSLSYSITNQSNGTNQTNGTLTLTAVVKNIGTGTAGASFTSIFLTTQPSQNIFTPLLASNQQVTVQAFFTKPSPGLYQAQARADSTFLVAESNENNNILAINVTI